MKTYNTPFYSSEAFQKFLAKHHIVDNETLFIQVFTSLTEKEEILAVRDTILSILPSATLIGVTTDGEICNGRVTTADTVVSLTQFTKTTMQSLLIESCTDSFQLGSALAKELLSSQPELMIVFTDGLHCNGEQFIKGIDTLNTRTVIAGGMAGDGNRFKKTSIFSNNKFSHNGAVGVVFHNPDLKIHTDYCFNWQPIGKSMRVTKVSQNRLYTLDDQPAYDVYRHYLGEEVARQLPAIGIEFPLIIQRGDNAIARAVLGKHDDGSLSFAGDFQEGDTVRFGYGDVESVLMHIGQTKACLQHHPTESIFVYSCMARRRFMPDLIEEEIQPLQELADVSGFFTYGEFFSFPTQPQLLNQSMTLLALNESDVSPKKQANPPIENETAFVLNDYQKSIKALSHLLDVTIAEMSEENKRLEANAKLLRAKKESLRKAQEIGHFGSWEIDLRTKQSKWSRESYRIYGLDPEKTHPTLDTFISMVIPRDRPKVMKVLQEGLDGEIKTLQVEAVRTDGRHIHLLLNGKILFDDSGNPVTLIGTTLDISDQVQLQTYNQELASIIEHSTNEVYIIENGTYRYLYVNQAALNKLGYSREEMYQMDIFHINRTLSREKVQRMEEEVIKKGHIFNRTIHTKKDGSTYPVQSYVQYRTFHDKEVGIIFDIDISEQVEAENRQREQAQILEQIKDSVVSTDLDDIVTYWNQGATIIHGYSAEEMIGKPIDILFLPEDAIRLKKIRQMVLANEFYQGEIDKCTKDGRIIHTSISVSVLKDESGNIIGLTRYTQDITHKKAIEAKLKRQTELLNFQAYHDALTGLPNRTLFEDRLQQSISRAKSRQEKLALLFIDLDNFKQINDTLGHDFGDAVLQIVAKRFLRCLRSEDTLARLGGDEFTVLIQNLERASATAVIAQKLNESLKAPITINEHELHLSASIGISIYPKDATEKQDLLKYADTAMYKAKEMGRDNYQFYSEEMTRFALQKAMMEKELRKAIKNRDFSVYYQPQIDATSGKIVGMEALVRWAHPTFGMLTPDSFILIAEESHLIVEVDRIVMEQSMRDIKMWYDQGYNPGILSLNLSIKQLMNRDFINQLLDTAKGIGFDIKKLKFEITESQMMHDPEKSIEVLEMLRDLKIKVAIDDFGTGYSSLAHIKRLPVKTLKIDRSFIQDLPFDEEDRAISKAIIVLAQSLNLDIVAEGVETKAQLEYLMENGCHLIQGYYFSEPLPKETMTTFMESRGMKDYQERR